MFLKPNSSVCLLSLFQVLNIKLAQTVTSAQKSKHKGLSALLNAFTYKCKVTILTPHLKLELRAAKVGSLLLPEVVGFDDECNVDAGWERLLQDLQQGLDGVPFGASHVHDDGESMSTDLLAVEK